MSFTTTKECNLVPLRKTVRPYFDRIGIGGATRQAFVETRLVGERLKFLFRGRPDPSSAILLAGSGRSGTTWITSIITAAPGMQQIFEPLIPYWSKEIQCLSGWDASTHYAHSFYLHPTGDYPEWQHLWYRILTGRFRHYWTDYVRNTYFPNRFLIKVIRANLMLGYLYDTFQPQIIYITRHPCAVVHSRLAVGWHADVADILRQDQLVETYLSPWVGAIERERDQLGAHAVWWAVENLVATQELASRPHYPVTYESLCLHPFQEAEQILAWLNLHMSVSRQSKLEIQVARPSRTSRQHKRYESKWDRLAEWQYKLSVEDQRRILDWARRVGIDRYYDGVLPRGRLPTECSLEKTD
jgi:hypothetical protein